MISTRVCTGRKSFLSCADRTSQW